MCMGVHDIVSCGDQSLKAEKSQHLILVTKAGCQPKTFKTFILMVKPLKPLFFSEKNLYLTQQTFIFKKSCFSVFLLCRALPIKMYTWENF